MKQLKITPFIRKPQKVVLIGLLVLFLLIEFQGYNSNFSKNVNSNENSLVDVPHTADLIYIPTINDDNILDIVATNSFQGSGTAIDPFIIDGFYSDVTMNIDIDSYYVVFKNGFIVSPQSGVWMYGRNIIFQDTIINYNCVPDNTRSRGIYLRQYDSPFLHDILILNCTITRMQVDSYSVYDKGIEIETKNIQGSDLIGRNITIDNCSLFFNNGIIGSGIRIGGYSYSYGFVIKNNVICNSSTGFLSDLSYFSNSVIRNNHFLSTETAGTGILIQSPIGVNITDNIMDDLDIGIKINNEFLNCNISNNDLRGVVTPVSWNEQYIGNNIIMNNLGMHPLSFTLQGIQNIIANQTILSLSWTASQGATDYEIFVNGSSKAHTAQLTYNHTVLENGAYEIYVRASNEFGQKNSNNVTIYISVFLIPFNFWTDAITPFDEGTFRLYWTEASSEAIYSLYDNNTLIQSNVPAFETWINGTNCNWYEVSSAPWGVHNYKIIAQFGDSVEESNLITIDVRFKPRAFIISSTMQIPENDTTFSIYWDNAEGVKYYNIYYFTELIHSHFLGNTLSIMNLAEGTHSYYIEAWNEYGYSHSTILLNLKYAPFPFTLNYTFDGTILKLNWSTSLHANSYSIVIDGEEIVSGLKENSLEISNISYGTYDIVIRAKNENGFYDSNHIQFEIKAEPIQRVKKIVIISLIGGILGSISIGIIKSTRKAKLANKKLKALLDDSSENLDSTPVASFETIRDHLCESISHITYRYHGSPIILAVAIDLNRFIQERLSNEFQPNSPAIVYLAMMICGETETAKLIFAKLPENVVKIDLQSYIEMCLENRYLPQLFPSNLSK